MIVSFVTGQLHLLFSAANFFSCSKRQRRLTAFQKTSVDFTERFNLLVKCLYVTYLIFSKSSEVLAQCASTVLKDAFAHCFFLHFKTHNFLFFILRLKMQHFMSF